MISTNQSLTKHDFLILGKRFHKHLKKHHQTNISFFREKLCFFCDISNYGSPFGISLKLLVQV